MEKKSILTGSALLLSGILIATAGSVAAARDEDGGHMKHNALETRVALEAGDYETWKSLVPEKFLEKHPISEEQFAKFAEKALESPGKGKRFGHIMKKSHRGDSADHEAIRDAVDTGDYETWRAHVGERFPQVTAENFSRLQELYRLHGQARTIMEELGMTQKMK